jgi:uncharacterized protein (TIGR03435 family)
MKLSLSIVGFMLATGTAAQGQAPTASKPEEFDVVSIKPNQSGHLGGAWGVQDNRYFAKNTPLVRVILQAYLGFTISDERLKGAPDWVMTEPYDITAKVAGTDADAWKGMLQEAKVAGVAPMLRSMLEERCKLAVHTVPTEIQGYALVVGKRGIRMKEAQPGEPVPEHVITFEGGWKMVPVMPGETKQSVTYLQITLDQFVKALSNGGAPILNQTGLTAKYDFELPIVVPIAPPPPPEGGDSPPPPPRMDIVHRFDWSAIGLEVKPIKVPALNLIVDHIERPTAN